ncbi:MAG: hypothetical protein QNJ92_00490 [Alphaproteobacteria bacterium]|nr:hypothetical protein [Alphaproteobacteria bacterium]
MSDVILLGSGGHAKAVVEAVRARGDRIFAYADPHRSDWLDADQIRQDDDIPANSLLAIGIGGTAPTRLAKRLALIDRQLARAHEAPPVIHPAAYVSPSAEIEPAATVLAGAVVQPGCCVRRGAIVNTCAVLEHDSVLGAGSHLAPTAVILGDCSVGESVMIGAGAVVLPGSNIPDRTLIPATNRFPASP